MPKYARRLWAALLSTLLLLPAAALAALDATDVIQIQATASLIRDNNLFRLPDGDPASFGVANKSDNIFVKGIGLKVDKLASRQRLIADINLSEQTYDRNTNLDFFGGDGRVAWLWQLGNHWNGEASYSRRRQLGGFSDNRQNIQDLIDTDTLRLSGGYQLHPRWRVGGEILEQEANHSASTRATLDYSAHSLAADLRYLTPAKSMVALQGRRTDRNYPNRIVGNFDTRDNGHQEYRLNATGTWYYSEFLKLEAQLGRVDVQHDQATQRDFSTGTWKFLASWDATSKLRFTANSAKDVRLYEDVATSYIIVNTMSLSPMYMVTSKVFLQADFNYERREYITDPSIAALLIPNREDKILIGRLALTYSPVRNLDLSLAFEAGDRQSTNPNFPFDYRTWSGTLRFGF